MVVPPAPNIDPEATGSSPNFSGLAHQARAEPRTRAALLAG